MSKSHRVICVTVWAAVESATRPGLEGVVLVNIKEVEVKEDVKTNLVII
jgi:hypothetical protein